MPARISSARPQRWPGPHPAPPSPPRPALLRRSGVEIGTVLDEQLGNESEYQPAIDMDFAKSPFTEDELPLATARVALAGAYLCLEGTLTGSLWFAVGTSAAGMLTAMLLARGYSGSGGGGMGSS